MSYRPWDWESTKFKNVFKLLPGDGTHPHPYDVYEIAADAMLEALRAGGESLMKADVSEVARTLFKGMTQRGTWVFIPDEEE